MTAEELHDQAMADAYRYLARRDRTVAEMDVHLVKRGVGAGLRESVLAELGDQGYLDDAAYARRYAEDRRSLDAWGGERIARTLRSRGLAAEVIDAALADRRPGDEVEAAVALLHRRLAGAPTDPRARERALGMLVRRGYELDLAHDAVRRAERELRVR